MNPEELIRQARRILETGQKRSWRGALTEAMEFFRVYTGERSAFFKQLVEVDQTLPSGRIRVHVGNVLEAFIRYVENGLLEGVSIERKAQMDVVCRTSVTKRIHC